MQGHHQQQLTQTLIVRLLKTHTFQHRSLIVKSQQNRIELVTRPGLKQLQFLLASCNDDDLEEEKEEMGEEKKSKASDSGKKGSSNKSKKSSKNRRVSTTSESEKESREEVETPETPQTPTSSKKKSAGSAGSKKQVWPLTQFFSVSFL